MKRNFTGIQKSQHFSQIRNIKGVASNPLDQSKIPAVENSKNRIVPIISLKRRQMMKPKAMFSSSPQAGLAQQPECAEIAQHQIFIKKSACEEDEERNAYLLQAMRNEIYLKKKKNLQKQLSNQGLSIANPNKKIWIFEQQNQGQQTVGLNKFTNILIKRLEKPSRKVSFSQFLEERKQQDYLKKFKYSSPKKSSIKDLIQHQKGQSVEKIKLKGVLNKSVLSRASEQNMKKHSRSVILTESRKRYNINRVYSKMHERYHSISGPNDCIGANNSLEISQIKLIQ